MTDPRYPKTIGGCIDMLYEQRAERLKLQKVVDTAKAEEGKLEDHILNTFGKAELRGAKGDVATASIKSDTVVSLTDWDAFINWASQPGNRDCLRKQPGSTAVKERWAHGEEVPGVESLVKISLSLTKAG